MNLGGAWNWTTNRFSNIGIWWNNSADARNLELAAGILRAKYKTAGYCVDINRSWHFSNWEEFKKALYDPCVHAIVYLGHGGQDGSPALDFGGLGGYGIPAKIKPEKVTPKCSVFLGSCESQTVPRMGSKTGKWYASWRELFPGSDFVGWTGGVTTKAVLERANSYVVPPLQCPCGGGGP